MRTGSNPPDINRFRMNNYTRKAIPVPLPNRLISAGLEPVLRHTEKLCIASYYVQFYTYIKMYNYKIKISFLAHRCRIQGLKSCQ